MTTASIITLRNELAESLRDRKGVSGVGVGKDDGHFVLVVSVDLRRLSGDLPTEYKGVAVHKVDLTDAELHFATPRRKSYGSRSRQE